MLGSGLGLGLGLANPNPNPDQVPQVDLRDFEYAGRADFTPERKARRVSAIPNLDPNPNPHPNPNPNPNPNPDPNPNPNPNPNRAQGAPRG